VFAIANEPYSISQNTNSLSPNSTYSTLVGTNDIFYNSSSRREHVNPALNPHAEASCFVDENITSDGMNLCIAEQPPSYEEVIGNHS